MWPFTKKAKTVICIICEKEIKPEDSRGFLHVDTRGGTYQLPLCEECAAKMDEEAFDPPNG